MPSHGQIGGGMNGTIRNIIEQVVDELDVGESKRINHTDCPAGEDTKRRLYITRKSDISLGYCHNCGKSSSVYTSLKDRYREGSGYVPITPTKAEYCEPLVVSFYDHDNIPAEADAWRIKSALTRDTCDLYSIGYVPEYNAIYIPFFDNDSKIVGHQLRPLHERGGAKYINFVKDSDKELGGIVQHGINTTKDTIVIVEDLVSAIHINVAGYPAFVNYGTHVKPSVLYNIPEYKRVVVWLDNDNLVVMKHAGDMYNILTMYGKNASMVVGVSDPKHYTHDRIEEEIERGRT